MGFNESHSDSGKSPGEMSPEARRPIGLFWWVNTAGWILFATFQVMTFRRDQIGLPGFMTWYVLKTILAWFVTVALRYVYRRVEFQKGTYWLRILAVFGISIIAANLWYSGEFFITYFMNIKMDEMYTVAKHYRFGLYIQRIFMNIWIMGSWSVLYLGLKFWLASIRQRERADRMEILAQKARLEMLRTQLNPHFLFNALYSIRAMAGDECEDMKTMINNLSAILRYSLDGNRKKTVSLSEEIEIIRRYLEIEKTRFDDLIEIDIFMDPAAKDFQIPGFLIHPLVENAVKYGMRSEEMPLRVELKAELEGDTLAVSIFDSGSWVEHSGPESTGMGLANVRHRLETAYPESHSLDIDHGEEGVMVRMIIGRRKVGI